ncbi:hypothetical protein BKA80DRAFT_261501 [Phyllosticta citrichinensis]
MSLKLLPLPLLTTRSLITRPSALPSLPFNHHHHHHVHYDYSHRTSRPPPSENFHTSHQRRPQAEQAAARHSLQGALCSLADG